MINQITKIAIMSVLAIILTAGAATAQTKGGGLAAVGFYTGLETAEGTYEPVSAVRFGNTFVLSSFGEWESYHLTASIDYSTNSLFPNTLIVTGGTWSLVVIRDNQYAGTLYGNVVGGGLSLIANQNGNITAKQVQINLRATGGQGIFANEKERDFMSGVYNMTTDLRTRETSGNAHFNF